MEIYTHTHNQHLNPWQALVFCPRCHVKMGTPPNWGPSHENGDPQCNTLLDIDCMDSLAMTIFICSMQLSTIAFYPYKLLGYGYMYVRILCLIHPHHDSNPSVSYTHINSLAQSATYNAQHDLTCLVEKIIRGELGMSKTNHHYHAVSSYHWSLETIIDATAFAMFYNCIPTKAKSWTK